MNKTIWCEVTCGRCGASALHSGYYSPERIKRLKAETKDWKHDDNYRVLCPSCRAEIDAIINRTHGGIKTCTADLFEI